MRYEKLLICGLLFPFSLLAQVSYFDQGKEDWSANEDAQNDQVYHDPNRGNPAPSIYAIDDNTGLPWYFVAPPCFKGDRAYAYGDSLSYDLLTNKVEANAYSGDVILFGANGLTLYHNHDYKPTAGQWTSFGVPLIESEWHKNDANGPAATLPEFMGVLSNLADLHILGEFFHGADQAWLDNVFLGITPLSEMDATICDGSIFQVGNYAHTAAGVYFDQLESISGCDSAILKLTLTVLPAKTSQTNLNLCQGQMITLPDGTTVTSTGLYSNLFVAANGCDSTAIFAINFQDTVRTQITKSICQGQTYPLPNGNNAFSTGTFAFDLQTINGCDSAVVIQLTVSDTTFRQLAATICAQETYLLPDSSIADQSGIFRFQFKTAQGCDSTIVVAITHLDSALILQRRQMCSSQTVILPDGTKTQQTGIYPFFYSRANGCDSTYVLDLEFFPEQDTLLEVTRSQGQYYTLPDGQVIRDTSLTKQYQLTNQYGCDSLVTVRVQYILYKVFIPNVFEPNGDGTNDVFGIFSNEDVTNIHSLQIYDRWGDLVFRRENFAPNDERFGWDGTWRNKDALPGVYGWWAEIAFRDGIKKVYSGNVMLVR